MTENSGASRQDSMYLKLLPRYLLHKHFDPCEAHLLSKGSSVLQVLLQHWAWRIVYMCHHVSRFQITAYPVVAYWLECLLVCSDDQTEHNGHLAPARTGKTSQQIADLDKASCAYYIYIYICVFIKNIMYIYILYLYYIVYCTYDMWIICMFSMFA